ncbi:MAG: ShlB/FhaC/HecB family hemolysin secretion/activation protein [Cyanobacteria bacterium P01_F01_bin.53]
MAFNRLAQSVALLGLIGSGSVAIAPQPVRAEPLQAEPLPSAKIPTPTTLLPAIIPDKAVVDLAASPQQVGNQVAGQITPLSVPRITFTEARRFVPQAFDVSFFDVETSAAGVSDADAVAPLLGSLFETTTYNPFLRSGSAQADQLLTQNAPASDLSEPEPELSPLPEAESGPVLPEATPEPTPTTPSRGDTVAVSEIQVIDSSVFSEADFDAIVSPYEGRDLGLAELRQVADDITQLYLQSGYITSRAVLSEQTIVDGVVQIRVVEGTLEEIQIEGTRRLANYVRDRVNRANRKPLNQVDLESQLQLLRADPLIERIEASLRAGTGEGQSQLIVRVLEAPAFSGRAVVDTNSPPSVGIGRMGIEANYSNALGLGDRLSLSAYRSTAGGSNTYGVTYAVPLNAMNGTIQARYLPSSFNLIDPDLAALGVEGSSNTYELNYRQPLIHKPNEELALSLGFRHRTGETLVSDVVIDSTRTSIFQFAQDYLKRDRAGAWGLRSQFNLGTGLLDATDRDNGEADGQFFSWLGQIQRAQVLNRNNLLLMQGSLQLSDDSLLGADQFIIGGASSVRGYSQNARFGDNGFRASIEDRITVVRNEDDSPFTQLVPFLDTAAVWNQGANTNERNFLLGTGMGLIINPTEDIQARLDVGFPLIKLNEAGDSDQNAFFYFTMDYRF